MISIFITLFSLITHDLPIINNTYKCKLYFPFIGNQNIQYIRYEEFTSALLLSGIINTEGKLFFDKNDVYNYSLDENINQILLKYKCKINEAYYYYLNSFEKLGSNTLLKRDGGLQLACRRDEKLIIWREAPREVDSCWMTTILRDIVVKF